MEGARARIVGIGTATSSSSYTQEQVLELFGVADRRIRSVFLNGGIERRYLTFPQTSGSTRSPAETQAQLLHKHQECGVEMASRALRVCLAHLGADLADIRHLCCVSSTGLLTPGFSAWLCAELPVRRDCSRLDVVGMGCNAGLSALSVVAAWAQAHPGELAVLICIEVCSAAYVFDEAIGTAVVNSLFGDGTAAVAVLAGATPTACGPTLLKFATANIPNSLGAMRFEWDETHGRFRFVLDRDIPYIIGAHAESAIDGLLAGTPLRHSDIEHWVVHSGGKKVIDSVRVNLGLTAHDLRHTSGVLRDYGNVSSGSFLFSLERLTSEAAAAPGDHGILMSMGPGSTIETALVTW